MIRPKDTKGNFLEDFNPLAPWKGFQEGNAVQYTFYVPHQIDELVDLVGQETFNNRLDSIFLLSQKNIFGGGKEVDAFAGLKTVYNHGNSLICIFLGCLTFRVNHICLKSGYVLFWMSSMASKVYMAMVMDRMRIKDNWGLGT